MTTSPFRTPGERNEEEEEEEELDRSLGPLRSRHGRKGVLSLVLDGGYPYVDLYQRGFVRRGANDTTTEVLFDEIDQLFFHIDNLLGTRIVIKTMKGREVEIPGNLEAIQAIHAALDRYVTVPFMKIAKQSLARGEHLMFGAHITLELDSIVIKGEPLPYSELEYIAAEDHVFVFYAAIGRFAWVKISEVPHPKVFLEVLRMRTDVVIRGFEL